MPTWPSTLPAPLLDGYGLRPVAQTIRTEMEAGAARVRRRTAARNDQVTLSWLLTEAQLDTFRDWFDDSATGISGGSAWFTILLAIGTGSRQASVEARFLESFTADVVGQRWKVSATLEIR